MVLTNGDVIGGLESRDDVEFEVYDGGAEERSALLNGDALNERQRVVVSEVGAVGRVDVEAVFRGGDEDVRTEVRSVCLLFLGSVISSHGLLHNP